MKITIFAALALIAATEAKTQPVSKPVEQAWSNSLESEPEAMSQDEAFAGEEASEIVATHLESTNYDGMGGPIEEQTAYPPCGPNVRDACIQLYEPGVTEESNSVVRL